MINKNYFIFILIILIAKFNQAQSIPYNYSLDYKLYKTNDSSPASNTIDRIFVQDKSTVWLGTSKGLSKTTDGGLTWINYYDTKPFGKESISAINFGLNAIWAGCWHFENKLGSDIPVGNGLRYSTDGGNSWIEVPQPVDAPEDSTIFYGSNKLRALPVTAKEQNFIYGIAFTKNTIWIVSFSGGLRKSTDMGKTWQRVVLPPDNLDFIKPSDKLDFDLAPSSGNLKMRGNLNHRAFSIISIGDTLYVGTAGGINKSTDGGVSWIKFNKTNQTNSISGNFVLSLNYNFYDNSIWAATWKAEGATENYGVSCSFNGGKSWNIFLVDERVRDFAFKYKSNNSYDVFAASSNGILRSSNKGYTWINSSNIIDENTKTELKPTLYLSVETNKLNSSNHEIWVGTNDGLAKTIETDSEFWNSKWKTFLSSNDSVDEDKSYAFPNPFNPKFDVVRIKYNLSNNAKITLRIFDFGMNLVRTVVQNANRFPGNNLMEIWDGKDENKNIVPNGVYFYRLDIDENKVLFGKIILLM
ncbi:MAG: hypothetical protein N2321_06290 [Melioribacteraceae bacterium]|nr:hypothetical protein [Melioribacteraceae bacterium]